MNTDRERQCGRAHTLPARPMAAPDKKRGDALRDESVLGEGDTLIAGSSYTPTVLGVLDNFREAYWVAAQVLRDLPEDGLTRKSFLDRSRKHHANALLLNELGKPEGQSLMLFENALKRFAELGAVEVGSGRDPAIERGSEAGEIDRVQARIGECLRGGRLPT